MKKNLRKFRLALGSCFAFALYAGSANAADPTAGEALDLKPVQADIQFERPAKDQVGKCTIHKLANGGQAGWVVRDGSGQVLRRFVDTNNDGKLDQWCYFREGVEVYRDIDANFNGKADQYRWLGTSGIRWGLDDNEDGRIDAWKTISPEEVTAEVVAAVRDKDEKRFNRLLITNDELKSLGLDDQRLAEIAKKTSSARTGFMSLADRQKAITKKSEWTNFGATQPGVLPAGTDGTLRDVTVYENVAAMVDNGGKPAQLAIGTLVQVGSTWRLIDLPGLDNQAVASNHFFLPIPGKGDAPANNVPMLAPEMQKLAAQLEKIDAKLTKAKDPDEIARLNAEKADISESLYAASTTAEDRENWIHQMADSISAAVQSGSYPNGLTRLKELTERLKADSANQDLIAYVEFRHISSKYSDEVQDQKANVAQVQADWVQNLETFVAKYPKSPDTAEAMFQLAVAQEFAGKINAAISWYQKICDKSPKSDVAPKAAGAIIRLDCVGKPITLRGRSLMDPKTTVDAASFPGQVVVVHYWSTMCEPCKQDFEVLKKLQATHRGRIKVLGVNLDNDEKTAQSFVRNNRLTWDHLYEVGGMESRLANELGIFTLPSMLLLDARGKVINNNLHAAELDSELNKTFKEPVNNAKATGGTAKGR